MNLPTTMKIVEITVPGGPEVLKLQDSNVPVPQADEVLIEVKAAGINRPDVLQRMGLYPMPKGVTQIPGLEVAGVVVAVGEQVQQFKVGDKVCALTNGGGYAEYCAVTATQVLPIPENLSFTQALRFRKLFYGLGKSFDIGRLKKDETALIHGGASGIGTTALAICHALGIKTFATVGSEDKVEALSDLTTAINYKTQDFEQEILNHTQEQGVDVILDIVGGSYFQKNLNLLKRDGRLVIIGFMGGRIAKEFDLQN